MSGAVLVLRPQPGAGETVKRARAMGLDPVVAPLFTMRALSWDVPEPRRHDAIFFTSANALRLGGAGLSRLTGLPAYAVGDATAAAARAAGFEVRTGPADAAALIALAAAAGVRCALHLCGRERMPVAHPEVQVEALAVYAADAAAELPEAAAAALADGAVVLIHSPRAAQVFAGLVKARRGVRLALISAAAREAAGEGWAERVVAPSPRDEALLEVARSLCQNGPPDAAGAGA